MFYDTNRYNLLPSLLFNSPPLKCLHGCTLLGLAELSKIHGLRASTPTPIQNFESLIMVSVVFVFLGTLLYSSCYTEKKFPVLA